MKKLFSVLMVVCLLTITLGVFTVSTMAETEVVVWEGDINQEITTSHMIGVINVDSLTQAIRADLAQNGTATKYVLTSTGSYYVGGESDYAMWGFYQENPQYVEAWANKDGSLSEATWTNTTELSKMGSGAFLCVISEGTDTVYVGHIKLIATHVPTTTTEEPNPTGTISLPEPTGAAVDIVSQGVKVWSGSFNKDFTTDRNCVAILDNESLNEAIYNDIVENGVAAAYAAVADVKYVSGQSGYASFCFYQDTPNYLVLWPDKLGRDKTSFVWTDASKFGKMGPDIQFALYCDSSGDVIHLNGLALYAIHNEPTTTEGEDPTATGTKPTATPSIRPTQVRDGVTQVYKFTFEDANATSILKVGDEVVGEVVEWPKNSGNHCLRYQLNGETRNDGGCHPYLWPEGIGESLCAQGDLEESGSQIELKIDVACSDAPLGSYMQACLIFNDLEENYADRSNDIIWPGTNQFNSGVVTWSSYDFSTPEEGYANGGIGFYDDRTLPDGVYMYIDNIEFNWIGKWIELDKTFVGYPGGILCEESDMELVAPTNPTGTGTETVTGTETATSASATETATETATATSASATETATATVTSATATETATKTATEAKPTATATETSVSESETSVSESETVTEPSETKTEPTQTVDEIYGDANGDGAVNMKDVLALRKYLADMTDDIHLEASDVNVDGPVNMKDVLMLRKFLANIIDKLGA